MLHILIDLGRLLAARRPSAADGTSSGSQPRSVSRVASSLQRHLHTGEEHACNVHDHRRRGRLGRCLRRAGRRGDG
jgi:hypothetical protein